MGLSVCTALFRRSLVAAEACMLLAAACSRPMRLPAISCTHHRQHENCSLHALQTQGAWQALLSLVYVKPYSGAPRGAADA